jgi:hypothetical protein
MVCVETASSKRGGVVGVRGRQHPGELGRREYREVMLSHAMQSEVRGVLIVVQVLSGKLLKEPVLLLPCLASLVAMREVLRFDLGSNFVQTAACVGKQWDGEVLIAWESRVQVFGIYVKKRCVKGRKARQNRRNMEPTFAREPKARPAVHQPLFADPVPHYFLRVIVISKFGPISPTSH